MNQGAYILMRVAHDHMLVGHTCKCFGRCQMAAKAAQDGIAVLLQGSVHYDHGQVLCRAIPRVWSQEFENNVWNHLETFSGSHPDNPWEYCLTKFEGEKAMACCLAEPLWTPGWGIWIKLQETSHFQLKHPHRWCRQTHHAHGIYSKSSPVQDVSVSQVT